jgi:putative isomerase
MELTMHIKELRTYHFIEKNLDKIFKQPRSFIRYPFIDPGSVYNGNVWDWDTYWSVYGLISFAKHHKDDAFNEQLEKHSKGNVLNFLDHQLEDGYIPMMIEVADWPEPYLNMKHKEGKLMNMHKPFLCQQIVLISDFTGDYTWIHPYISQLEKYFACYEKNYYFEDKGLYVWADDIMIGMDNDPATFGRPGFSTANIYLNSFMVMEFEAMIKILVMLGDGQIKADTFKKKKNDLAKVINEECWDVRDAFYYSVDVDIKTRPFEWIHQGLGVFWKTLPIKIRVWSGFLPLLAGVASQEQAKSLKDHAEDEQTFWSPYGITTLAKDEKMFDLSVTNNPSNWLGPIWLVANYAVFKGLLDYGFHNEALSLAKRTIKLLEEDLARTGDLHEYYDPYTGQPIMNGGFINWNILGLNMIDDLAEKKIDFFDAMTLE